MKERESMWQIGIVDRFTGGLIVSIVFSEQSHSQRSLQTTG